MVRIWSELRGARTREQFADVATVAWVAIWGFLAWQVYAALAAFAESGRLIRSGGTTMIESGRSLGDALAGIPLVGAGLRDVARNAFAGGGCTADRVRDGCRGLHPAGGRDPGPPARPRDAGAVALRGTCRGAGSGCGRREPGTGRSVARPTSPLDRLDELLALRAVTRLDYATLLDFTPDPLGDWAAGRHDRLARAELASVGLRG